MPRGHAGQANRHRSGLRWIRADGFNPFKDEAERRFPYRVDVPVVRDSDLAAMLEWCCERVPGPRWACHGHDARVPKGEAPAHCTRWYFLEEADAEAFRRRWAEPQ